MNSLQEEVLGKNFVDVYITSEFRDSVKQVSSLPPLWLILLPKVADDC